MVMRGAQCRWGQRWILIGTEEKWRQAERERAITWIPIDKEQEGTLRGQVRRRANQPRKRTGTSGELKPRLSGALLFP